MIDLKQYQLVMENGSLTLTAKQPARVIFSVPHDGMYHRDFSNLFSARKNGFKGRDARVWPLANIILNDYEADAIRGLMPRTYIDYNRHPIFDPHEPDQLAYEDNKLATYYDYYHATLDKFIARAIENYKKDKVLLIDFHGFGKQPPYAPAGGYDLILGTSNRKCVKYGEVDIALAETLTHQGYAVFLPQEKPARADRGDYYNAGFITRHYSEKWHINAIQIEIARRFRDDDLQGGEQLAHNIALFLKDYF